MVDDKVEVMVAGATDADEVAAGGADSDRRYGCDAAPTPLPPDPFGAVPFTTVLLKVSSLSRKESATARRRTVALQTVKLPLSALPC